MHLRRLNSDFGTSPRPTDIAISIFAVIVLYKMRPEECTTLNTLFEALGFVDDPLLQVSLLVADNTPGGQRIGELPAGVRYQAFPDNPGLVTPYRRALALAESEEFEWLLTLDQDTHLPLQFLSAFASYARRYRSDERVAAIVPRIYDNGRAISPFRFVFDFIPRVIGNHASGLLGPHASALNSASLLRVSALKKAGGYDERFPLNNSDTALFHRLDKSGYRIALAYEVVVEHELAIMSRGERMTVERYRQLLVDEHDFWKLHMTAAARAERLLRLIGRLAKSFFQKEDAALRHVTQEEIRRRLFTRRSRTSLDFPR